MLRVNLNDPAGIVFDASLMPVIVTVEHVVSRARERGCPVVFLTASHSVSNRLALRHHVPLDRFTGVRAVHALYETLRGLYDFEVVLAPYFDVRPDALEVWSRLLRQLRLARSLDQGYSR